MSLQAAQDPLSAMTGFAAVAPTPYADGQLPSFSDWIFRSVRITAQSIIDPLQYLNQQYQVHDYAVEGLVQPIGQNIAVLTAQGALKASTLVPEYGIYMDTPQDVYRNILSGGAI